MELLLYWKVIKKRLWLIVLLMVVAGASAFYYGQQQVPVYSTSTTLFLNAGSASPYPLASWQTLDAVQLLADTYSEYMRTRSFSMLMAEELDPPLPEVVILGALSSEYVADTQFFKIRAVHPDPQTAQVLANTAAQVLISENIARQQAQRLQLEAQRDPVRIAERERLLELKRSLEEELAYAADRIASLQAEIAELEAMPPSEEIDRSILALRNELIQNQSLRVQLFNSLAQTQAALAADEGTSGLGADTAVVVDPAPLPMVPQSRNLLRYVLLAVAAAGGLGIGLAFLIEYLDWTIKTPEELDAIYGLSTLGVIGVIKNGAQGNANQGLVVTVTHPQSAVAEAFRALRTNIRFANPDRPVHSLLVTSAAPLEGKTLTSANLAVILAQGGRRVILVDTDLRRPRVHRLFGVASDPGFTDLIVDGTGTEGDAGDDGIEALLQPTEVENLRVLACGPLPRNPAELLGSDRCAQVMEELQRHADIVIYDSPPAASVTDAVVLGSRVDGVVQVVKAGGTRRDVVLRVKGSLEKVGARLLGPVLNQVSLSDLGYYSYYYYGYYRDEEERTGPSRWLKRRGRGRHSASAEKEAQA